MFTSLISKLFGQNNNNNIYPFLSLIKHSGIGLKSTKFNDKLILQYTVIILLHYCKKSYQNKTFIEFSKKIDKLRFTILFI